MCGAGCCRRLCRVEVEVVSGCGVGVGVGVGVGGELCVFEEVVAVFVVSTASLCWICSFRAGESSASIERISMTRESICMQTKQLSRAYSVKARNQFTLLVTECKSRYLNFYKNLFSRFF